MDNRITIGIKVLREAIDGLSEKQRDIIAGWLIRWAGYIKGENTFNSSHMKSFIRGEIILVDFGFRLKSELGGYHYAVVMDKRNNPNNPLMTVVPMSSLKEGRTVHPNDVDLGIDLVSDIDPATGTNTAKSTTSMAVIQQLTCISKQRVIRPLNTGDKSLGKIIPTKMAEIDEKIANRYLASLNKPSV